LGVQRIGSSGVVVVFDEYLKGLPFYTSYLAQVVGVD
jgi:hypothetical protein